MTGVLYDNPVSWQLLWAVVGLAAIAAWGIAAQQRAIRRFADAGLLALLAPAGGLTRRITRLVLGSAALTALVWALAGPRWGETTETVFKRNIDVIVCLDVSRSMLARDIAPNRLERAKLSIVDDLAPALAGDRIGVVAFAGVPRLVCPLTDDYGFLRLAVNEIDPRSAPVGGTMIGDAVREAATMFQERLETHKVILLITDGEDQGSFPLEAAEKVWREDQIPIVAVAIGDEREGARVPAPEAADGQYLKYQGETVWSKADFSTLRQMAAYSDLNAFVPVGTRNFDLGAIYREKIVPAIRYRETAEQQAVQQPAQYHWFAGAALLLVLIDSFLRDGRPPKIAAVKRYRAEAA